MAYSGPADVSEAPPAFPEGPEAFPDVPQAYGPSTGMRRRPGR